MKRVDFSHLRELQMRLAQQLILHFPLDQPLEYVCGLDAAYDDHTEKVWASAVMMRLDCLEVVGQFVKETAACIPYRPGYLCFREGPPLLDVIQEVLSYPCVFLVDGHGIAHPRRMGLASFVGLMSSKPSIGCAKELLFGCHAPVGNDPGAFEMIVDTHGNAVGLSVRTKEGVRPIFISPGHLMDLESAYKIVMKCVRGFRIPEPLRLAHSLAKGAKKASCQRQHLGTSASMGDGSFSS